MRKLIALLIVGFSCIHYETEGVFVKDMYVYRCEDEEVVCYIEMNAGGMSCVKKESVE